MSAIRELLDDPAARQRLAESGRRRLAADYSREVVRDQLLDAVRALGLSGAVSPKKLSEAALPPGG